MTRIVWDAPDARVYETGIDRGVLYLNDGTVVPWSGLTSVEEDSDIEVKEFHLDGVKYLQTLVPGDFSGKLKAYTYPDEFDEVNGIAHVAPESDGLDYYNQAPKSFSLSYRTLIGDPIKGVEAGYKIHILYNIFANPDSYTYTTLKDSGAEPTEFSWSLSGIPPGKIQGFRPTLHISIDSRKTPSAILRLLEDMLYGPKSGTVTPHLPTIQEVAELYGYVGALVIVDHGSGLWSAIDESDTYITMVDSTTFEIDNVDGVYLNPTTYSISSTNTGV